MSRSDFWQAAFLGIVVAIAIGYAAAALGDPRSQWFLRLLGLWP